MQHHILTSGVQALVLSLSIASAAVAAPAQEHPAYWLADEIHLPGAKVGWDYLNFDRSSRHLFIARRDAGVWIWSPDTRTVLGQVAESAGANGVALAPDLGRGYTTNRDGTTTVFDLKTLKTLVKVKVAGDNDANTYDPLTKSVIFINGDSNSATFLDATTNKVTGKVTLDSEKPEFPSVDGRGKLYVAIQDKNVIAVIDTTSRTMKARWPTTGCDLPTATRMDPDGRYLFVGCRGTKPVLLVMDASAEGKIISTIPIGHGVDAIQYDPHSRTIFVSSGVDGNITVARPSTDGWSSVDTIGTRPMARTMALDPGTGALYVVTAQFNIPTPPRPGSTPKANFLPGSFTLLTYMPQS